jgi:arabinofuranosyltransferase
MLDGREMLMPQTVPAVIPKWIAMGAVVVLLGLVLRSSWVTEDAYITLRTVDNWVRGHGLRWNVDERVQAYTHPAWMLLLSAGYFFTREAFVTTIFMSVLTTALAVATLVRFARTAGHAVSAVVLLTLSRSFVEYSTSGLENPLSHLMIATFIGLIVAGTRPLWQLALSAAVLALTRIDALIVVLPALLHASYLDQQQRGLRHTLRALALGVTPLLAWEAFSILYYGFPFPNTAYAKLNTGIPRLELIQQGLVYWGTGLAWDPPVHVVALFGVAIAFVQRRRRDILIAFGLLGYVLYVVCIGGDFMQGRFWTIPLFTGACLIAISELPLEQPAWAGAAILPFAFLLVHPLATESLPIEPMNGSGIADERGFYRNEASLVLSTRTRSMPEHEWMQMGRDLKANHEKIFSFDNIGFLGYSAGPTVHIIDQLALSEPLLARLPMRYHAGWRVGHYHRYIPQGYRETVAAGGACKMTDANLCEYYGHLREVVAGPLFSWSRIKTIAAFNLGLYERLIDRDRYRYPEVAYTRLDSLSTAVPERAAWNSPGTRVIGADGLVIELGTRSHAAYMDVSLDGNDRYLFRFMNDGAVVGVVESQKLGAGLMRTRRLVVPTQATREGFTSILVRPGGGDGMYSIGYLRMHDK